VDFPYRNHIRVTIEQNTSRLDDPVQGGFVKRSLVDVRQAAMGS